MRVSACVEKTSVGVCGWGARLLTARVLAFAAMIFVVGMGLSRASAAAVVVEASAEAQRGQVDPSRSFVVVADRAVMPDGTLARGVGVLVENGKIRRVLRGDEVGSVAGGLEVYRFAAGSVLSPGLIDGFSELGIAGRVNDQTSVITPERVAVEGFNVLDPAVAQAAMSGVTSAVLHPGLTRVVAGSASVVKTAPVMGGSNSGNVVLASGPMVVNFTSAALNSTREPTSRAGAAELLRRTLAAAKREQGHAASSLVKASPNNVLAVCETEGDVDLAVRIFGEYGVMPMIVHSQDGTRVASDLAEEGATVFLGPYGPQTPDRVLLGAGAMSRAGVEVVLVGGLPSSGEPDSLRLSAGLSVRYGLDAAKARRGMTSAAAAAAGVSDRIGSIRAGLDADLVVFSADPLNPGARAMAVWIDGRLVVGSGLSGVVASEDGAEAADPDEVFIGGSVIEQRHVERGRGGSQGGRP